MIITHIVVLNASRTFKTIPHIFFSPLHSEMKMQSRDIDNAGGKIIIIICRRLSYMNINNLAQKRFGAAQTT